MTDNSGKEQHALSGSVAAFGRTSYLPEPEPATAVSNDAAARLDGGFPTLLSRHLLRLRLQKTLPDEAGMPELAPAEQQAAVLQMLVKLRETYGAR